MVALHAAYLVYQMLGGLLAFKDRRWLVPHVMAVTWGIGIVVVQGSCPVTALEKGLWVRGGSSGYDGSFLDHYVFGSFLPNGSQPLVYGLHLVVIIVIYVQLARRWHSLPGAPSTPVTTSSKTPSKTQ